MLTVKAGMDSIPITTKCFFSSGVYDCRIVPDSTSQIFSKCQSWREKKELEKSTQAPLTLVT